MNDIPLEILESLFPKKTRKAEKTLHLIHDDGAEEYQDDFLDNLDLSDPENPSKIVQNKAIYKMVIPPAYFGLKWIDLVRDLLSLKPQVICLAIYTSRYTRPSLQNDEAHLDNQNPEETKGNADELSSHLFPSEYQPNTFEAHRLNGRMAQVQAENVESLNQEAQNIKETKNTQLPFDSLGIRSNTDLEEKRLLDLDLVITNPLPTTLLTAGDEAIIMGGVVDIADLGRRRRQKEGDSASPSPMKKANRTMNFVETLVRRKKSKIKEDKKAFDLAVKRRQEHLEFLKICLRNLWARIDDPFSYEDKITQKSRKLLQLKQTIDELREKVREASMEHARFRNSLRLSQSALNQLKKKGNSDGREESKHKKKNSPKQLKSSFSRAQPNEVVKES